MTTKKPDPPKTGDPKTTEKPAQVQPEKLGRNSACPCGSGKKYKFCCGRGRS